MKLGKKEMVVVVIHPSDMSNVPERIRKELSSKKTFSNKTGISMKVEPWGFVTDMGGEDVLMHFSNHHLKEPDAFKKFTELSKKEKNKPAFGTMAHMLVKTAKVETLTREAHSFRFGYAVKQPMMRLENIVKHNARGSAEAQAMIDAVNNWGKSEAQKIKTLLENQPTIAFDEMLNLSKMFKGMPLAAEFPAKLAEMKKDKDFISLYSLRRMYKKLLSQDKVSESSKKQIIHKLNQFITRASEKQSLVKDAQSMISSL